MLSKTILGSGLFCLVVAATPAAARDTGLANAQIFKDDHRDTFGNRALDEWLETRLGGVMKSCLGVKFLQSARRSKIADSVVPDPNSYITAIPDYLSDGLGITADPSHNPHIVLITPDAGIPANDAYGYFAMVYPSDATRQKAVTNDPTNRITPLSDGANLVQVAPMAGVSNASYSASCADVVSAKMQAGVTLPLDTIKSALAAQYDGSNSYALNLVYGRFSSGIYEALTGLGAGSAANRVQNLKVGLAVWNWYLMHQDRLTGSNWILAYLDGVTIYRESGNKREVKATASASTSLNLIPFVNASADATASPTYTTSSQSQSYEIAALVQPGVDQLSWKFLPLTPPQTLADAIAKNLVAVWASDDPMTLDGPSAQAVGSVQGLAECNPANWTAYSSTGNQADVTLAGFQPDPNAKVPTCLATFQYTPAASSKPTSGPVVFGLRNQINPTLAINVAFPSKTVSSPDLPTLALNEDRPSPYLPDSGVPKTDGAYVATSWTLKFLLRMNANQPINDANALRFKGLTLKCDLVGDIVVRQSPSPKFLGKTTGADPSVADQDIEATINVAVPANKLQAGAGQYDRCDVQGAPIEYDLYNPKTKQAYRHPDFTLGFPPIQLQLPLTKP